MKSAITDNLGFALKSEYLQKLIDRPNPIPMSRWLTLGSLDPTRWQPLFGAQWKRRSGMISVEGTGNGWGGRSLCLLREETPELPYELAVTVRLDNEAGGRRIGFSF